MKRKRKYKEIYDNAHLTNCVKEVSIALVLITNATIAKWWKKSQQRRVCDPLG